MISSGQWKSNDEIYAIQLIYAARDASNDPTYTDHTRGNLDLLHRHSANQIEALNIRHALDANAFHGYILSRSVTDLIVKIHDIVIEECDLSR